MANKTESTTVNETTKTQELQLIKNANDLPILLPANMDKKELFNIVQDTEPLGNLTEKKFKILGILPEIVQVPPSTMEGEEAPTDPFTNEPILVDRLRVTLITDIGVYHSFSVTFNKALAKALNVFGNEYTDNTYTISTKLRGSGQSAKAYYVVKVV